MVYHIIIRAGLSLIRGKAAKKVAGGVEKEVVETTKNKITDTATKQVQSKKQAAANDEGDETGESQAQPKKSGVVFWLLLIVCILKDLLDILCNVLIGVGAGLTATFVGSIIGVPLMGVAWVIGFLFGIIVDTILLIYFMMRGEGTGRRLGMILISLVIDNIPALSLIPTTTVMFILASRIGKKGKMLKNIAKK